jgi:cytidine deaminase
MTHAELMAAAAEARKASYSPYSGFKVGAALLGKSGKVYTGCNVENAAYTPTNCAERTAIFKAVSEGETQFEAIAIVGGKEGELQPLCAPGGVCRQALSEFCNGDLRVVLGTENNVCEYTFAQLLPLSFGKNNLE